jgi:hypothetical protein
MIELLSLRGLLFVEGIAATLIYGWIVGTKFVDHGWSYRVTAVGFFGILGYVSAVQVKAYKRHSPFDGFSWLGLIALTVVLVGFTLYVSTRTDSTDGT